MGDGIAGSGERVDGATLSKITPDLIALATVLAAANRPFHADSATWRGWSEGERAWHIKRALVFADRLGALGFHVVKK